MERYALLRSAVAGWCHNKNIRVCCWIADITIAPWQWQQEITNVALTRGLEGRTGWFEWNIMESLWCTWKNEAIVFPNNVISFFSNVSCAALKSQIWHYSKKTKNRKTVLLKPMLITNYCLTLKRKYLPGPVSVNMYKIQIILRL